jgi:hypothetical protein
MRSVVGFAIVGLAALLVGCGEQYCQMSANSGARCYNINEVEWQESQSTPPPPPERETRPSPGCALLTTEGVYLMPQDANQSQRPPSYLMSGACVTRRRPVPGLR